MGRALQLFLLVGDLVPDRRNDLRRLCFAATASALRPFLGCGCGGWFLVDDPTSVVAVCAGLAMFPLALFDLPTRGNCAFVNLSPCTSARATDIRPLGNGHHRGSGNDTGGWRTQLTVSVIAEEHQKISTPFQLSEHAQILRLPRPIRTGGSRLLSCCDLIAVLPG